MSQLSLFKYFKVSSSSPQATLPSPNGPLSREIPITAISAANKEVKKFWRLSARVQKGEGITRSTHRNRKPPLEITMRY